jgi:hypothetical protein
MSTDSMNAKLAAYALARRHKAHAWIQHWRFGSSLSGPTSFLVHHTEKPAIAIGTSEATSVLGYLAPAPQFREHSLLHFVWQLERSTQLARQATPGQRRQASINLLRLVSDAHPWAATPHVKRFLAFVDPTDPVVVEAFAASQSEHGAYYWNIVKRVVLTGVDRKNARGLEFGADLLAWLDSGRGRTPTDTWRQRAETLLADDDQGVRDLARWMSTNAEQLRRHPETGEVIVPISRWLKSVEWFEAL